jgi:lactate permease
MATWSQDDDPLHAWPLSTLVAAPPALTLFFVLLVLRASVWAAAPAEATATVVLAIVVFGMPATLVGGAFALVIRFGLWRIAWIIIASIFLYDQGGPPGRHLSRGFPASRMRLGLNPRRPT